MVSPQENTENSEDILNCIQKLPCVLIEIIIHYIPKKELIFVNKINYINNHSLVKSLIPYLNIEQYIRNIICRDYEFVFEQILKANYLKWFKMTDYQYKNIIYKNYVYFIKDFCIDNESNKCTTLINNFLEELGLCKNQHKKNINKHIRWKN
jgi:hypothetical protein